MLTTAVPVLEISDIQAVVLRPRPSPYRGEYVILRVDDAAQGREMVRRIIAHDDLSISKIACLLGYSDVSAFTNAYKRRTGQTPRETRQRLHREREESQAQKAD